LSLLLRFTYEGADFKTVQKEVSDLLNGRILVGHAVHHDLKVNILFMCSAASTLCLKKWGTQIVTHNSYRNRATVAAGTLLY